MDGSFDAFMERVKVIYTMVKGPGVSPDANDIPRFNEFYGARQSPELAYAEMEHWEVGPSDIVEIEAGRMKAPYLRARRSIW